MLYKKNPEKELSKETFKNPGCEYRGAPFWSWNCELSKEELLWQIEILKKMGFGGFHMHVRTGMSTKYLSDEFMDYIESCVEKAKDENMYAYLYDEDRWPSGAAGGYVTKDRKYSARYLLFTHTSYEKGEKTKNVNDAASRGGRNGEGSFLAAYDVVLDSDGYLKSYKRIGKDDEAKSEKWYAYLEINSPSSWFNNETYADTLNKSAIVRFTEITHERYKERLKDDFGETVPSIFTDEPQFSRKDTMENSFDKEDLTIPWTDDIPKTYKETYGEDILDALPEVFWDLPDRKVSVSRYRYHDHISERFAASFADTVGDWCRKNNIYLTGHMMEEPTLKSQTAAIGEAMRSYRSFDLPGIDMLADRIELTTAKQAQSASHQYGREGVLSELYGVTGWDFDFRGHKFQGDWQAALGVTLRVPHLSWVSMKGEAKRDYPASINYQSPWYKEYSYVEDHFARVNTAMTRGEPVVKVGVIHPVESYWLHWGPNDKSALIKDDLDRRFQDVTNWLLKGNIDFDFICESLLPSLCEKGENPFKVGKMKYEAIVVPGCETLRSATLERLEQFKALGGKLIFMGEAPKYEDAKLSDRGENLYNRSDAIPYEREKLLTALAPYRTVTIRLDNGKLSDEYIYQMRKDGDCEWLFVSRAVKPYNKDILSKKNLKIRLKGEKKATVYDTLTGNVFPADAEYLNGDTVISKTMYDYDSLLLKIEDGKNTEKPREEITLAKNIVTTPSFVDYTLDEKNAALLDMCEWAVDDGEFHPTEEILRLDNMARDILGIEEMGGNIAQPWTVKPETPKHTITLKFTILSEIDIENALLALEDADKAKITLNGKNIENKINGFYVDKSINAVDLGTIGKGENILTVTIPIAERTNTEWLYLLGDFSVKVFGKTSILDKKHDKIAFGDITAQGLPFYGGNITYHLKAETKSGEMTIYAPRYRGALIKVYIDGKECGIIAYPPYSLKITDLENGPHDVDLKLFGNRFNAFGAVHNADLLNPYHSPWVWRTENDEWSYEYNLKPLGILSSPVIKI